MKLAAEKQTRGYALAASAAILWSTLGFLGKFAYELGGDPLTIISIFLGEATTTVPLVGRGLIILGVVILQVKW